MGAPVGNNNAAKGRIWGDAIRRAVARRAGGDLHGGLEKLADELVNAVATGDMAALREFGDRIEGKAAQAVTVAGDPDAPLTWQEIGIRSIDATDNRPTKEGE